MPLWMRGDARIVATGWGIARRDAEGESLFRFPRAGLRRDQEPPRMVFCAVLDERGERALVRRNGEGAQLWSAADKAVTPASGPEIVDAIALDGGELLVLTGEPAPNGRERLSLARARVDGDRVVLGERVRLPEAKRAEWPSSLFKKGRLFPEDRHGKADGEDEDEDGEDEDEDGEDEDTGDDAIEGHEPYEPQSLSIRDGAGEPWLGRVRLFESPYGIAVASTYSGLVAVFDRASLAVRLIARVPTELEPFDIFALPVSMGVLVTLVASTKETEIALIDESGTVVAHKNKAGKDVMSGAMDEGIAWTPETAFVMQLSVALPKLTTKAVSDGAGVAHTSSPDGRVHLVAYPAENARRPSDWRLVRTTLDGKKRKDEPLPMPELRPVEAPVTTGGIRRATGAPLIGLVAETSAWGAPTGKDVEIALAISNRGGPLKGMYVELGGPGLAMITPGEAVVGTESAAFAQRGPVARAELSATQLEPAFIEDGKKGDREIVVAARPTRLVLRLRAGARTGSALLTVRVGPVSAKDTSGSALQGRTFTVSS